MIVLLELYSARAGQFWSKRQASQPTNVHVDPRRQTNYTIGTLDPDYARLFTGILPKLRKTLSELLPPPLYCQLTPGVHGRMRHVIDFDPTKYDMR